MERTILHCDCNGYFASVECIARPELWDVPMAVCGDPKNRHGVILAKNELAKGYGIVTAETVWQALRKCPNLTLVRPHHEKYREYSRRINAVYQQYTDQVEAFSVDESWLDVTASLHLFGTGKEIADELRRRIRTEIGLTISVGVSFCKTFAKLGSDYKKPDATTEITRENFRDILWPLPARSMLYVGRAAEETLLKGGIRTIGDIAEAGKGRLRSLLGRTGETIWEYACGLDEEPVKRIGEEEATKSIGCGLTFSRDLVGLKDIRAGLTMLSDTIGTRLRRQGLCCTTVQVQIKNPQLQVICRQKRLEAGTNSTREILEAALSIVQASWRMNAPIRMLTVTAAGLSTDGTAQLSLFDLGAEKRCHNEKLDSAMDAIRAKFGESAISYGNTLHQDIIYKQDDE
ncbi:MAG: DNA polymerase IV [Candidatus Pelethousia sp.]|nr:DNA polymerase IV [Candidatus Pelethousia sp.]